MRIDAPNDRPTVLRVKATGQIQEFIPSVARAMLTGGTAELVNPKTGELVETAAISTSERAVAPAQTKKPKARAGR